MRLFISLLATVAMFLSASTAFAAATWTVSASTNGGGGLGALQVGDQIILDITLRTDDSAFALAGSVNNYDNTVVGFNAAGSAVSATVLAQVCFPSFGCVNGLANQVPVPIPLQENAVGPGVEVEYLAALAISAALGDGSVDEGIVTGVAGDAQFRIVFNALAPGTTTLNVGTFAAYLDGYTGTVDTLVNNPAGVTVTVVPEPGTALLMGLGLAGLAAAGRRE
jgi:hypothetical protein